MSVITEAAEVIDRSTLARAAHVLKDVRTETPPGSMRGHWVKDPRGEQGLICVWVPEFAPAG